MDLKVKILEDFSKPAMLKLVDWVGEDVERYKELMELFFHPTYRIAQRAAWPLSYIVEKHPEFLQPFIPRLLEVLSNPDTGETIKRNTVRMLSVVDLPDQFCGQVFDSCYRLFTSIKEPIAVRVFSITVMANIAFKYPELIGEVQLLIQNNMLPGAPASILARGKNELKRLNRFKAGKGI